MNLLNCQIINNSLTGKVCTSFYLSYFPLRMAVYPLLLFHTGYLQGQMGIEIIGLGYGVQLEACDLCVHGYSQDAMDCLE